MTAANPAEGNARHAMALAMKHFNLLMFSSIRVFDAGTTKSAASNKMNERSAAIGRDSLPHDSSLIEYIVFATQGFISRKKTEPFAEFSGTVN
jgi:hypothetical protein